MVLSFQTRRKELGSKGGIRGGYSHSAVWKSGIILSAVAMPVLQSTNLEFNEIVEYCHMEATLII